MSDDPKHDLFVASRLEAAVLLAIGPDNRISINCHEAVTTAIVTELDKLHAEGEIGDWRRAVIEGAGAE